MKETSSDGVEKAYSIRCLILKAPEERAAEMPIFLVAQAETAERGRPVGRDVTGERGVPAAGAGTFTKRWTKAYSPWRSKPVNMGV